MLEVTSLFAGYGGRPVLEEVNVSIERGRLVGLLGANNAGKSTFIHTLSGVVPAMSGRIRFEGEDITALSPQARVERGIIQVPEGRLVFPDMTIRENLLLGGQNKAARGKRNQRIEQVLDLLPRLEERLEQKAGTLSGGEQQMLAIGRGLVAGPKLLMLDEPSLGLAPKFVQYIFEIIDKLHSEGLTVLLVEQNLNLTLRHASYCYVLERGRVEVEGESAIVRDDPRTKKAYLGL
jgi:branched-chain amino acid transport system ATP-binding protein